MGVVDPTPCSEPSLSLALLASSPARSLSCGCSRARRRRPRGLLAPGARHRPRREPRRPSQALIRLEIHGEEQIRVERLRSFPLDVDGDDAAPRKAAPARVSATRSARTTFASHWLRITPTLQIGDKLTHRRPGGSHGHHRRRAGARHVAPTRRRATTRYDGYSNVQPRWLYVEWLTPVGLLRVGQQPSHWGMGIVANDGDHPSLFGDYRYGNIVEQVLFATKPLGEKSPFVVALGGQPRLPGQRRHPRERRPRRGRASSPRSTSKGPTCSASTASTGTRRTTRSPSRSTSRTPTRSTSASSTSRGTSRGPSPCRTRRRTSSAASRRRPSSGRRTSERTHLPALRAGRGRTSSPTAARRRSGVVLAGHASERAAPAKRRDSGPTSTADVVAQVEVGYASGDANPDDDTEKRFVFDPNHKVGLLLFDEVMRWQTARARPPRRTRNLAERLAPAARASNLLPSNGGVFGAQYIYPTAIYRPTPVARSQGRRRHRADDGRLRRSVPARDAGRVRELHGWRPEAARPGRRARRRLRGARAAGTGPAPAARGAGGRALPGRSARRRVRAPR